MRKPDDDQQHALQEQRTREAMAVDLAALRADAERLNWLEKKGLSTTQNGDGRTRDYGVQCWRDHDNGGRLMWTARYISSQFTDLRAAIDAAMKQETK